MTDAKFSGARDGEAPLTWGQYGMWLAMRGNPRSQFSLLELLTVPSGAAATVPAVAEAIGALVSRHEALRTLLRVRNGEPRQYLVQSGCVPVRVVETTPEELEATANRERLNSDKESFDREADLPTRASLIVCEGMVQQILLVFDHLAVDAAGAAIAAEDLRALLQGDVLPPCELQPIDLARREQAADSSITDNATRYWVEQLQRIPPRMFAQVCPPDDPRTQVAVMFSPALVTAGSILAARHKTSLSTTLLAAAAALIGAWTGHPTIALNVVVGNRFRPGFARLVSNLQKLGLFVLDATESSTFDDLLPKAHVSALRTYRYAYYDHAARDRALSQVTAERGTDINPFCCFNDFSRLASEPVPSQPDRAGLRSLLTATTLEWRSDPSQVRCHFCLRVRGRDHADHWISLSANTDYLPRQDIEHFLLATEWYVVTSLFEDVPLGTLRERLAEGRWQRQPGRSLRWGGGGAPPSPAGPHATGSTLAPTGPSS